MARVVDEWTSCKTVLLEGLSILGYLQVAMVVDTVVFIMEL